MAARCLDFCSSKRELAEAHGRGLEVGLVRPSDLARARGCRDQCDTLDRKRTASRPGVFIELSTASRKSYRICGDRGGLTEDVRDLVYLRHNATKF